MLSLITALGSASSAFPALKQKPTHFKQEVANNLTKKFERPIGIGSCQYMLQIENTGPKNPETVSIIHNSTVMFKKVRFNHTAINCVEVYADASILDIKTTSKQDLSREAYLPVTDTATLEMSPIDCSTILNSEFSTTASLMNGKTESMYFTPGDNVAHIIHGDPNKTVYEDRLMI